MIAREGWLPIVTLGGVTALVAALAGPVWSIPVVLLLVGAIVLFRESEREVPAVPLAVVSPLDATIIEVGAMHDPWLKRDALVVRMRVSFPGITCLRCVTEGKVMDFFTNFGATDAPADSPTAYVQSVRTDEGEDATTCVVTRRHSRFKADAAPGERVGQGQRSGFVFFAREVAVYLPANSHAQVTKGEAVLGGSSIIATLVRRDEP